MKRISKVVPIVLGLFGSLPGPATDESAPPTIDGKVIAVGVPVGSIVRILPAWSLTVKLVAKVNATVDPGPID